MSSPSLGRLEQVPLRDAWASEAGNFTPWLAQAENLQLLGECLGMNLELEAQERSVGPFRADLLCRETATEEWVLIENQLERTDHSHLGQLLTYAAGLAAVSLVWIAERFTEEHRAALDWLNEKTPEGINFFGLEVELWRIGDSAIAPKFNVVSKPNAWTRRAIQSRDNSETRQMCLDFWTVIHERLLDKGILSEGTRPFRGKTMRFDVGWKHFFLKAYFSTAEKKQGVWVSCRGPRGFENFEFLRSQSAEIEAAFGEPLEWTPEEDRNQGSLVRYFVGPDANDREDWPRQQELLASKLEALYRAVLPFVERLDALPDADAPAP